MSEEVLKRLVIEITDQKILGNYLFYLLVFFVTFVSSAITAFATKYFSKRGENLATKADLKSILDQVSQTTTVTESIKTSISHDSKERYDVKATLREKMELLLNETYSIDVWLEAYRSKALRGERQLANDSPLAKIEMYRSLYFHDTDLTFYTMKESYYRLMMYLHRLEEKIAKNVSVDLDEYGEAQKPFTKALEDFRNNLLDKYAEKIGL